MRELDGDKIVAEALRLLDEHGVAGLSIRRIAKSLDVTPMALYHHIKNKADLAERMVDAVAEERPLSISDQGWRENLLAIAVWSRQSNLAHPAMAELRRTYGIWTPSMLTFAERWVTEWRKSGLPPSLAVLAAHASSRAINGLVATERLADPTDVPSAEALEGREYAQLLFRPIENDERLFELSARALINGLYVYFDSAPSQGTVELADI